jgi:tetratricopeptide (TPR) repeat protein
MPTIAQPLDQVCGDPFTNTFGPFDYRTAPSEKKGIVERHHFTPNVETLRSGNSGTVGAELDYTLRVFPNHPRALMAMVRLGHRDKTPQPKGTRYSVECFVERAIRFRPDDLDVRQVRGIYLTYQGRYQEAKAEFKLVIEKDPNNGGAHYNLGLAHLETKDYSAAVEEAKAARALGVTLTGLSDKLKAVGKPVD